MVEEIGRAWGQLSSQLRTFTDKGKNARMTSIDANVLAQLPLTDVVKVAFYKRDAVTTDLICCDVMIAGEVRSFHEELVGWGLLLDHLQRLPSFRADWFETVSLPPFSTNETVAFSRP